MLASKSIWANTNGKYKTFKLIRLLYFNLIFMDDQKLYELEPWTLIQCWNRILEFIWIDWAYARWHDTLSDNYEIVIMWHANQNVSEYWEIID